MMKSHIFRKNSSNQHEAYLWYETSHPKHAVLFDPGNQWTEIKIFLDENSLMLKWIFLTQVSFETSRDISEIQKQTGAHFLSFQSDLLKLRMLPRWADERNVCGIKIPQVNQFVDGHQTLDLEGFHVYIESSGDTHHYACGKLRVPEK